MKRLVVWMLVLLAVVVAGCSNNSVPTAVSIKMVNLSNEPVYLWMGYCEERNATTLVAGNSSRTFHQVFTFTDEHPQTHLTIYATKGTVYAGEATILVNADTTKFTAVYKTGEGITITKKE